MSVNSWRLRRVRLLILVSVLLATPVLAQSEAFVRVKVEIANVREGPGTSFSRLWRAYENDPLKVVERKGEWLSVEDFEGMKGWIYSPLTDTQPAVIVKAVKEWANVRSGPGSKHSVAFRADRGVSFRLLDKKGKWLHIQHADGDKGWVHASLVWPR